MNCQTVRTEVHIAPDDAGVQQHLQTCRGCTAYAQRFARLDVALRHELIQHTPDQVQQRLHAIAFAPVPEPRRVDVAVRDALLVAAPSALTSRLLDLVPQPAKVTSRLDVVLREALVLRAPPELTARLVALVPQFAAQLAPVPRPRRWVVATVYMLTAVLLVVSLLFAGQIYGFAITQLGLEHWLAQLAALPAVFLNWLYTTVPQSRAVVSVLVGLQQPLQWLLVALVLWAVVDMTQRRAGTAQGQHQQTA